MEYILIIFIAIAFNQGFQKINHKITDIPKCNNKCSSFDCSMDKYYFEVSSD